MNTEVSNLSSKNDKRPPSPLVTWLRALDAALRVIEGAIWEMRTQAIEAWEATQLEWGNAASEIRELKVAMSEWQQQIARLSQAGWSLTKIASSYRLHVTKAAFVSRERAQASLERLHEKNSKRFLDLCLAQGGGFLKVGQLLSARPDLLPTQWIETLSSLQDDVPALPFDEIRPVVESELGVLLDEHFSVFEEAPIGAASIGQVHRALLSDNTEVAVKVRRPGVEDVIELDMQLLASFLNAMRSSLPEADYDTSIAEIQVMVRSELDYAAERAHGEAIGAYFGDSSTLFVPAPVAGLCTDRLLTTHFAQGEKITIALDRLAQAREQDEPGAHDRISKILSIVIESYVGQILEFGRFQADPHPGNLLVSDDDNIVLLDFGCTKVLTDEARRAYAEILQAFFVQDRRRVADLLLALGFRTRSGEPETLLVFADVLLEELRAHRSGEHKQEWPSADEIVVRLTELMQSIEEDPVIEIPDHFVMIGRVLSTLGGLFMHYRPTLDVRTHLLPVVLRAMSEPN